MKLGGVFVVGEGEDVWGLGGGGGGWGEGWDGVD